MTNAEFKSIRQSLGLTQAQLAGVLGYAHTSTLAAFEYGRAVPVHVALLMRAYAEGYRPANWPA